MNIFQTRRFFVKSGTNIQDDLGESEPKSNTRPPSVSGEAKGLKRRLSESARDLSSDGISRLSRIGSGLRRRLSFSTKDLINGSKPIIKPIPSISARVVVGENNEEKPAVLQRHLSSSLKDLAQKTPPQQGKKAFGNKISRRFSYLSETVLKRDLPRVARLKKARRVRVQVIFPDGTRSQIEGLDNQSVSDLLTPHCGHLDLTNVSLNLAKSGAELELEASASLLDGDTVLVGQLKEAQSVDPSGEHVAFHLLKIILAGEELFITRLHSIDDIYLWPLKKLGIITDEESNQIFGGIEVVRKVAYETFNKISSLIKSKQKENIYIGDIFTEDLWNAYEHYFNQRPVSRLALLEKEFSDEEFTEVCRLQRGAGKFNLHNLLNLPADRLLEYEQYFASLLIDTHPDHPEFSEISRNSERLGQLVSRRDDIGELERIQELFPNDNLRLYENDPVAVKMKGLVRKKSTTAARLHRAFSAKGIKATDTPNKNNNKESTYNNYDNSGQNGNPGDVKVKRQFIMETPVQFTAGVQSQARHLFLFTDLLLIAKARSGGNFKLKEKVRVSEMWLANCLDDVAEVSKSPETSFVVGWPTSNVIASFSCVATKDLWYNKLSQVIIEEREKDAESTNIQITYYDSVSNTDICKTMNINNATTSRECISLILDHLEMTASDPSKFQLWVKSPGEESPYPLIGHEYPFAIKMNSSRYIQDCGNDNYASIADVSPKCVFILRKQRDLTMLEVSPERTKKSSRKYKKTPINIQKAFKKNNKGDVTDSSSPTGVLFGINLSKICEQDGTLPRPIMGMLHQLIQKGPFTVGMFRKSANARIVREMKEKLDRGRETVDFDDVSITIIAGLFKDFLRSMPDCLLCSDLYDEWLTLSQLTSIHDQITHALNLCSRLSTANLVMLQHFLCLLYHISRRSSENMMTSSNLGVCVGPSLLWSLSPMSPEASKQVPAAVEFLIDRCAQIFGRGVLNLLGEVLEVDPLKQDSGAEESDSLHSGHSLHSSGVRRDDSSIDSLEREFLVEGELCPLPRKEKLSLTNLSRDSGLTLSDSQLYTADEEEIESSSSSNSGDKNSHTVRLNNRFEHYTAPNNPNAIYTAIYRCPEKVLASFEESDKGFSNKYDNSRVIQISRHGHAPKKITVKPQDKSSQMRNSYDETAIYSVPNPLYEIISCEPNNHFQRHDWMRKKSNLRKLCKTNSGEGSLLRSNSEESLVNKYNTMQYGVSLGAAGNNSVVAERPINNTRNMAEEPFAERNCPLRRSRSAHHIEDNKLVIHHSTTNCEPSVPLSPVRRNNKWRRSHSNPQIHEEGGDRSYDSSTLSDDDSTPHVSRSNSRVKELGNTTLHTFDSYDPHHDSNSSAFKSELSSSLCTVVSAESSSTLSSNPPSYEETLNRRSALKKPYYGSIHEYAIREEKVKSARAKQLYEESLRIYQEENTYPGDLVHASPVHTMDSDDPDKPPPLPPKSDIPPLPPKQRMSKRVTDNGRLKHLPPVHIDSGYPKKISTIQECPLSYTNPIHKTIIYTKDNPPLLPPKEKTVIEVNPYNYSLNPERIVAKYGPLSTSSSIQMKSIETQTDASCISDENDEPQPSTLWTANYNVITVPVPDVTEERRGRSRKKRNSSFRSRSMPGRDEDEAQIENCEQNNHTDLHRIDSDLQQEINWSVSQLRAIFGDSLNGAKVHPPPYRPPPSAMKNPQSFQLQNGDILNHRTKSHSNYAEESYV